MKQLFLKDFSETGEKNIKTKRLIASIAFLFALGFSDLQAADRFSVASGDWGSTSTWSATSGGSSGATVPVSGDRVFIEGGFTVTVSDIGRACLSIELGTSAGAGTLFFKTGTSPTLTVTDEIQVTPNTPHSASGILDLSPGCVLTCGGIIQGTGGGTPTFETDSGHVILRKSSFLAAGITVFDTLTINGVSSSENTTVNNNLAILGNLNILVGKLSIPLALVSFFDQSISGTGNLVINNGAFMRLGGNSNFPDGFLNFDFGTSSTIEYYADGAFSAGNQQINELYDGNATQHPYPNLIITGNGNKTFAGDFSINGTLTLTNLGGGNPDVKLFPSAGGVKEMTVNGPIVYNDVNVIKGATNFKIKFGGGTVSTTLRLDQTSAGTRTLHTLTMESAGQTLTLATSAGYIATNIVLTSGKIAIGSNTVTSTGSITGSGSGFFIGGTTSNLTMTGSTARTIYMDQTTPGTTNLLNNVTLGNSSLVATLFNNLQISGTLLFTNGKLAVNGNTLTIKGGITNTVAGGIRGSSSSSLVINGSVSPILSLDQTSSGTTNLFDNLTINSVGQNITLGNNMFLNGVLTLTGGILTTESSKLLTMNSTATSTGASGSSYVSGPLRKIGTAAFVYPVGKAGKYAPCATGAASGSNTFTAEYFKSGYGNYSRTAPVNHISVHEYWDISRLTGSSAVSVTLHFLDGTFSNISTLSSTSDLFVSRFDGSNWVDPGGSRSFTGNASTGSVTTDGVNNFSPFTFASESANTALPVTWLSFTGKADLPDRKVDLNWKTASEENSKHFEIERSISGKDWEYIGIVKGNGNTTMISEYFFTDNNPYEKTFYRLKQVDFNGVFSYSKVIWVELNALNSKDIIVYPNPSAGNVNINGKLNAEYEVSDMVTGQLISKGVFEGPVSVNINKKGVFLLKVIQGSEIKMQKILIQ